MRHTSQGNVLASPTASMFTAQSSYVPDLRPKLQCSTLQHPNVDAERTCIPARTQVEVVSLDGGTLIVRPLTNSRVGIKICGLGCIQLAAGDPNRTFKAPRAANTSVGVCLLT